MAVRPPWVHIKTFHVCSTKLPKNVAAVFNLREVDGVEGKEICALLNISENNFWMILHRARMALRRCLETNWFGSRMCPNENPRFSQNPLDRMGVESHAKLRGDVAAGVEVFGTAAIHAHLAQDATALPDLRLVQTLFCAIEVSP